MGLGLKGLDLRGSGPVQSYRKRESYPKNGLNTGLGVT